MIVDQLAGVRAYPVLSNNVQIMLRDERDVVVDERPPCPNIWAKVYDIGGRIT